MPDLNGYPLGVIPSPPDERDYPYPVFGKVLRTADMPETFTLAGIEHTDDQGAVEACVACSLGLAKDWQEGAELGRPVRFSRQFIYSYRPNRYFHQGPGMIPRQALYVLTNYGIPTEDRWTGLAEFGREVWPSDREAVVADAWPFRVATYLRVDPSQIAEIKSAVFTMGPVLYCVPLHSNFAPDGQGVIPLPSGMLNGYHAMSIIGWCGGYWLVQNSWNVGWGQGGRCWMPWNYPALELWQITDAKTVRQRTVEMTVGSKTMLVDGKPIEMDVAPEIVPPGRTMLPVRFVAEGLGAEVEWYEAEKRVRLTRKEHPWP